MATAAAVPPLRRAKISQQCSKSRSPRASPSGRAPSSRARSSASRRTSPSSTSAPRPKAACALREFAGPGRQSDLKVGDTVEVYLERVENALGEAVLSRDKARREESWGKLEKAFNDNEKVSGVIFNQVKGGFTVDLDGAVAFLPRTQVDIRPIRDVGPLMNSAAAVPDPEDGPPPRQHRRLSPHRPGRDPRRAAPGTGAEPRRGPGHRRRGQEHHRLRRVRRPRRHRRPPARHRHRLAARQSPDRGAQHRPAGEGQDHQDQPRDPPHLARHEAAAGRSLAGHRGEISGRRQVQGPRHQHHRLRRVRGARARHRGPDPRLRNVVDQEERASRQDRLDLARGRGADPRGRSGQAAHLARSQADHAQSVGSLRREVSARHDHRRRGQEQDRVRPVPRPRWRRRRHGPSLRPRLEASGRAGDRGVQEGRQGHAPRCSTSTSRRSASRSASSSSKAIRWTPAPPATSRRARW